MNCLLFLCRCILPLSLILLAACGPDSPMGPAGESVSFEPQAGTPEWLVYSPDGADPSPMLRELGVGTFKARPGRGLALVQSDADLAHALAQKEGRGARWIVERNDPVELVEAQDYNQGYFESWDAQQVDAQDGLAPLDLDLAHAVTTGAGVRIAVVDTGIDPDHPRLAGKVDWFSTGSLGFPHESSNGLDDDGDGIVDEGYGHGTHVAGLIASVAPDATLLPVKVFFEDGMGTEYHLALALQELLSRDVDLVNLSMRLSNPSPTIESLLASLAAQGVRIVAAAGNQAADEPAFPASHADVLAVAATDAGDALASFSNFGAVDFAAAGVGMRSSYPDGSMSVASGTSMSCAVATGSLALLIEAGSLDPVASLKAAAVAVAPVGVVTDGRVDPTGALGLR